MTDEYFTQTFPLDASGGQQPSAEALRILLMRGFKDSVIGKAYRKEVCSVAGDAGNRYLQIRMDGVNDLLLPP